MLVLAALVLGDRIRLPHVPACTAATTGVALLVLKATAQLDFTGVLAAVGGAASMASGVVLTKRWRRPAGVDVLLFTGWQLTAGGLVLLPALVAVEGLPSGITGANALGFGYLIVFGSLFGYSVWFRGTDRVPAIGLSFLGFCSPIVATALGRVPGRDALAVAGPRCVGPGRRDRGGAADLVEDTAGRTGARASPAN
ncbi:EamA family transporter [Lentzea sp. NPDC059081]|uniref:EamA family transporter n=1 Tax=Lentzea sp. NPDC059081 TaxID=3346719 RepID=UPI00367AD187